MRLDESGLGSEREEKGNEDGSLDHWRLYLRTRPSKWNGGEQAFIGTVKAGHFPQHMYILWTWH
jgi:hypothetical protein